MVMFAFKLKTPNLKKAWRAGDVQGASAVGVLSCRLASLPGVQGGAGVCLQLGLLPGVQVLLRPDFELAGGILGGLWRCGWRAVARLISIHPRGGR
jgi:hypothetical protein